LEKHLQTMGWNVFKKSLTFLSLRLQKIIMVILKKKLVYGYPTHKRTLKKKHFKTNILQWKEKKTELKKNLKQ
jgi:hypothetical protein